MYEQAMRELIAAMEFDSLSDHDSIELIESMIEDLDSEPVGIFCEVES